MKRKKNLLFLLTALVFAGCASTDSGSAAQNNEDEIQPEVTTVDEETEAQPDVTRKTLIDRYISGEVPGYKA